MYDFSLSTMPNPYSYVIMRRRVNTEKKKVKKKTHIMRVDRSSIVIMKSIALRALRPQKKVLVWPVVLDQERQQLANATEFRS